MCVTHGKLLYETDSGYGLASTYGASARHLAFCSKYRHAEHKLWRGMIIDDSILDGVLLKKETIKVYIICASPRLD